MSGSSNTVKGFQSAIIGGDAPKGVDPGSAIDARMVNAFREQTAPIHAQGNQFAPSTEPENTHTPSPKLGR